MKMTSRGLPLLLGLVVCTGLVRESCAQTPNINMNSTGPSVVAGNGAKYYVGPNGSDSNNGTSPQMPFKTFNKAESLTNPGDTVYVMDGTYNQPLYITRSGSVTGGYITYQAYPGAHPLITNYNFYDGIMLYSGASYIILDGFSIVGAAQTTTAALAQSLLNAPTSDLRVNGNCIGAGKTSHDVIVRNNNLSYCPGGGIVMGGDYLYIHHNIIHHNAFWSPLNDSGITVAGNDSDTYTGTKIFLYDNILYANQNFICNVSETNPCRITDGEGIIVDTNVANNFGGRVLIYNNLAYGNGGPGIEVVASQHVDIINNTTYMNNVSASAPSPYTAHLGGGEIAVSKATDVNVLNNIMYASSNVPLYYTGTGNVSYTWDYNLLFGGHKTVAVGAHDLVTDPMFINAASLNFHLNPGSPAIGSGTSTLEPALDFDEVVRPAGQDTRGAYQ